MQSRRRTAIAAVVAVLAVYAAAPYVTLYRLADSIRRGDAASLEALVDWDQVREGIKEDICDTVFDTQPLPAGTKEADALPPFGFSFVRGIAGNVIDENVTPTGLVTAASQFQAVSSSGAPRGKLSSETSPEPRIAWAFFASPRVFHVDLLAPAEAGLGREPIRLQMELSAKGWKVTRAWLPPSMLTQANPRT